MYVCIRAHIVFARHIVIHIYINIHTNLYIYYIIVRNLCRGVKTHKLIIIVLATGVSITDRKLGVTGEDVTFPQVINIIIIVII